MNQDPSKNSEFESPGAAGKRKRPPGAPKKTESSRIPEDDTMGLAEFEKSEAKLQNTIRAAVTIQKAIRGYFARNNFRRRKDDDKLLTEDNSGGWLVTGVNSEDLTRSEDQSAIEISASPFFSVSSSLDDLLSGMEVTPVSYVNSRVNTPSQMDSTNHQPSRSPSHARRDDGNDVSRDLPQLK